jgi:hypothetical protein
MTISREELYAALEVQAKNITKHIDLKIKPIAEDVEGQKKTLFGKEGRNGLVGDVNLLKWGFRLVSVGIAWLIYELPKYLKIPWH